MGRGVSHGKGIRMVIWDGRDFLTLEWLEGEYTLLKHKCGEERG